MLAIAYPWPDPFALLSRQEHVEVQHAFERSRAQVRSVEQHRERASLFAEEAGVFRDLRPNVAGKGVPHAFLELIGHAVTKVISGPCATR